MARTTAVARRRLWSFVDFLADPNNALLCARSRHQLQEARRCAGNPCGFRRDEL